MKLNRMFALAAGVLFLASTSGAFADTKIQLKTHLCCGNCVKAVAEILKGVDGVKGSCDQSSHTVTITAKDDEAAQKAVDALAAGGFDGAIAGSRKVKVPADSGATKGKVKSLTITDVHNCCGKCNNAIKAAVKKVPGVKADTAKVKETSFEVTGDFDAEALVKALAAAGFHAKVKKE